ncbi:MAG: AI-2E family transporter [Arthrobacter sp.]|uniref:AI-2E family transporter n=1 Tax=Arthrobacter sp. TaxID=1667 RepID=UPI0034940A95
MDVPETTARPRGAAVLWSDTLGRFGVRSAQILLLLALATVTVYGLLRLRLLIVPVMIAIILAAAIAPFVNFLRRKGLPGALATAIAFLGLLAALGGVVTAIVFAVRSEWDELAASAASGVDELQSFILDGPFPISAEQIAQARDAVVAFATSAQGRTGALTGVSAVAEFLTGATLMVVVLFFLLKDGATIWNFLLTPFHGRRERKLRLAGTRVLDVLGGYVRGTTIVALVDAVVIGAALLILRVPLAGPLAVIVFVGAFVPIVGATVAGALAALVALVANGPLVALIVVGVVVAVTQLEGDLLQPLVMGKSLRLHALVVLMAITAGTVLAGIAGAVLAVPLTAVAWAVVKVWTAEDPADAPGEGRPAGGAPPSAAPVA